jgi:hypothetical protein
VKRGTPRHPKTAALQRDLKIPLPTVVGYLELLFHFTAEFAPQGDIGKYEDSWIEASLGWTGKPGRLISALIASHWLDYRGERTGGRADCLLYVHDWHDHAEESVKLRLKRANLPFLSNHVDTDNMSGHRGEVSPSRARALPLPLPIPDHTNQPPTPAPRMVEWPLTSIEIRKHFPAASDFEVLAIVQECVQACISIGEEPPDDEDISAAVKLAHFNGQENVRGFRKRAPQVIKSWIERNKHREQTRKTAV